jgi:hypothetical protein
MYFVRSRACRFDRIAQGPHIVRVFSSFYGICEIFHKIFIGVSWQMSVGFATIDTLPNERKIKWD